MDFKVKNANCKRVLIVMERLMAQDNRRACSCSRCIDDIAALALNLLPPHYIAESDEEGEKGSPWVMVETAVEEAMDRVAERPKHSRDAGTAVRSLDPAEKK